MGNITESVDVEVPINVVYNQWTQFESFPQFMDGVDEIKQLDDTHTHWITSIGGITREFDATITEQHPEERVAWTTEAGTTHAGVITFHRLGATQTRVTAQMDIEAEGIAEKVADAAGIIDRKVKGDMQRFKKFIEARNDETGAWRGDVDRPGA
ncbi:SRPBCC family protein [Kribbella italica]|uniref:Putative membrane protein n=1 Tax=Kribbella italica TaxID=1540520 RepID=A0A7W9J681_9ACTN|nr:SRPBCC family protein [Kribbella italica]MBB5835885.1 putative membrane protein [Kribbella italica]